MNDPSGIVGNKYGDMVVTRYCYTTRNFVKMYEVECSVCGKKKMMEYSRIKSGSSCVHSNKYCGRYVKAYDKYLGLKKGDFTIVKFLRSDRGDLRYIAKCSICGCEFETTIGNFKRGYGTSHSRCITRISTGKYSSRFKKIYQCMRYRTTNFKYGEWETYGGRGISSDYYSDFSKFYFDQFEFYKSHVKAYGEKNTTIDRIDANGDYTYDNIRWATLEEQGVNKRNTFMITLNGKNVPLRTVCRERGLPIQTVYARIKYRKWSVEDAINIPIGKVRHYHRDKQLITGEVDK